MSKKTTTINTLPDHPLAETLTEALTVFLSTPAGEKVLVAAMDRMFTEGKWEIPDDAVSGKVSARVDQIKALADSNMNLTKQLAAELRTKTNRK